MERTTNFTLEVIFTISRDIWNMINATGKVAMYYMRIGVTVEVLYVPLKPP